MSFALHEAGCFKLSLQIQNVFTILMTVLVRWPSQTSGAFGLALIFLLLFASRQKVDARILQIHSKSADF